MGLKRKGFIAYYWSRYLVCEKDLGVIAEYVALRERNLDTCSERIAQLYLTAVNGVESVLKLLYPRLAGDVKAKEFAKEMLADKRFYASQVVLVPAGQDLLPLVPFGGMDGTKTGIPKWWSEHVDLKHDRITHFDKATLRNLLHSMAAYYYLCNLYMVESCEGWLAACNNYHDAFDRPDEPSAFFVLERWESRFTPIGPGFIYGNEFISGR